MSIWALGFGSLFMDTSSELVALYRKLLVENMESIQRGEDPMGIVRDPAKNEPMIKVVRPHERPPVFYTFDGVFEGPSRPPHRG
jgi:hypothetical protein